MAQRSTTTLKLEANQARAVNLAAQGLLEPPTKPATKSTVLALIRRMGALQIDTISVVARSPYLVLWSRLGAYPVEWLDQLLVEAKIFEYWSHAACFLPIEDYPLYRTRMHDATWFGQERCSDWIALHLEEVERVREAIRSTGPMRSVEFGSDTPRIAGWWEWKPAKKALEMLFTAGELMIARRENFHRVYDLRERVLPNWDDAPGLSVEEAVLRFTEKAVRALGITAAEWAADYFRLPKKATFDAVAELTEQGVLLPLTVAGWERTGFVHRDHRKLVTRAIAGRLTPTLTTLLSPFDPIVWDRERARAIFDFDYRLECYTPEAKRRYGYFTLPILHRGALVGRMDAKAHRKDGVLEIKIVHLEPGVAPSDDLAHDVAGALRRFADWQSTPRVEITRSDPPGFRARLRAAVKPA